MEGRLVMGHEYRPMGERWLYGWVSGFAWCLWELPGRCQLHHGRKHVEAMRAIGIGEAAVTGLSMSAAESCARVAHVVVLMWHSGWQEARCSTTRYTR